MNNSNSAIHRSRWMVILIFMGVVLLIAGAALAQSGGEYDLGWNTVDGGGITFAVGGSYRLAGTAGQADAGAMGGGVYGLGGGFWAGLPAMRYQIYLPLVSKS